MKRFGTYESDFANLFECYTQVNSTLIERDLPSSVREINKRPRGLSFDNLQIIKIYQANIAGGGELTHIGKGVSMDSDDGNGNVVMSCTNQDDNTMQIVSTDNKTTVRVVHSSGEETMFNTDTPLQFDEPSGVLTIINPDRI